MTDFYTRDATIADIPFLIHELEIGAREGHFSTGFLHAETKEIFRKQIRTAIRYNEEGRYSGHLLFIILRRSDDKKAGVIWFTATKDISGFPVLELRLVDVIKELRGKGCGSWAVSHGLELYSSLPIMAKCFIKSNQMADMLKRRGFHCHEVLPSGTQVLYRDPQ